MNQYRKELPFSGDRLFLTDGGLETTLIFHESIDLPLFAAFELLRSEDGRETLRRYYERYIDIARQQGLGFVLETPTWRASPDWARQFGHDDETLVRLNREAISLMRELRARHAGPSLPMLISGNIGPRGDGYRPDQRMSTAAAREYHRLQAETFAGTDADMISAFTINYIEEAIGIVEAARESGMPVVISYTVETDGRLPTGESLTEAIERTDQETDGYAAYYMINCAHPTHFESVLPEDAEWLARIRGLRANASCRSHAELDEAEDLDDGDPRELGRQYRSLLARLPALAVLGGCCGTDHRHVAEIAAACGPSREFADAALVS